MVITLVDFAPPGRMDGIPWTQARIEESDAAAGTYAVIETLALSPVDDDPASPLLRDFTTDTGTLAEGWYRVIFLDAQGNESQPSAPIHNVASPSDYIRPNVRDLGSLMRARTKDRFGSEVGTFNANTRPTRDEAEAMIDMALELLPVNLAVVPERLYDRARRAALLLAAQLVEGSFYPEQADSDQSAAALYAGLYTSALTSLQTGLDENEPGVVPPRFGSISVYGANGRAVTPEDYEISGWEQAGGWPGMRVIRPWS